MRRKSWKKCCGRSDLFGYRTRKRTIPLDFGLQLRNLKSWRKAGKKRKNNSLQSSRLQGVSPCQKCHLGVKWSHRLRRILMPTTTFPIVLTQSQRKAIAKFLPSFTAQLKIEDKASRTIKFSLAELQQIAVACKIAHRHMTGMVRNSLRHVMEAAEKTLEKYQVSSIARIPAAERLYQFKITLKEIEPRSGGEFRSRIAPSTNCTSESRRQWAGRIPICTSS